MSAPAIRNYLHAIGLDPAGSGPADAELIARFAATRDESAFELLVWRHAPLIQSVCRAVLRDHHAAEDAAQATFLVLARKAATFANRGSVVGWLYRVARRVSVRLAKKQAKLPAGAKLDFLPDREHAEPIAEEYAKALCAEVDRLPERYRVPILLCFFEGLTQAEAARRTGWPIGTVAGRLARAKTLLARRLSSRGVTLGAVALPIAGGSFVGSTAQAAVAFAAGSSLSPASPSVLGLANGATKTMTSTLLKLTAAAAVLCSVTAGVWGFTNSPEPQDAKASPPVVLAPAAAAAPNQKDDAKPGERLADARQRQQTMNSLKQVMLAIFNHHDATGQFPGNIVDKNGKALLSWRVAILPYIEQENLYKQFKLDEPWDSDHNKKLIAQMPPTYRIGFQEKDATKTYFQVFAGPGTAFEPGKKITVATITDGTSNTLGPIVAGPAVEWTKPADIAYDAKKPFPKLEGPFKNVLLAAMMDGSVRTMNPRMKIEEFRKLVECADGNPIDPNASAVEIKPVTKEDKELLGKLLKENEELSKKVSELLIERTKLVILTMRKQNATTADLDRVMREHDDLERAIEHLTDEIKKLKENSEKK